jgi:PPOX class probable F420-dependent enzyme
MSALAGARYLNLVTFRKSGVPVETPIWFAESAGRLYAFSAGDAGKIKRLRRTSQARVAPCDVRGRVTGPWLDARARVITDPALAARAMAALHAKYGWQMRVADFFSTLSGRIQKRALIEMELGA